ncbi:hypothetical protein H6G41_33585 [Tolypothrix sp. FACHB-123]|uniref:RAMP superfamily CRISPR-associated protein n=1 Tax=Tolypothrix sp. FACHB-123 TaxID=2692868 RepID=UPI0016844391|nr:RAMP superfamily CRISPR-associated protein [Tolypothrix sp. FACHB-123]MBD2359450.1 hypothetical protein [Tolypothrix sp. FACHB-123]
MSDCDLVPLMYRAQIEDRGKIQYAGDPEPATQWVNQWLDGCPPNSNNQENNVDVSKVVLRRKPQQRANFTYRMPQFATGDGTWEQTYTINWRLVTNSGQDEDVIRPVIGAKGIPYYPGSSMKGAFLRACQQIAPDKVLDFCGGEVEEIIAGKKLKRTQPGILRFHGGYPVDMSWGKERKRLVDVVHSQEKRQVIENINTSANVQISLYKTKFKFGISSTKNHVDWQLVQQIWERALSQGIGSRTSAGYGRFKNIADNNQVILSVNVSGKGLTSTLLTSDDRGNKIPEFRPNMFKAALRGHTLRLLAGVTNEATTQRLTKELWGGFLQGNEESGSIVGKFGIDLQIENKNLAFGEHNYFPNGRRTRPMPLYNLKSGRLDIFAVKSYSEPEREFLNLLIKFSLLLGGFGKSWRRIHHDLFYQSYFRNNDKPMIGCHWLFSKPSESPEYCITAPRGELDNIRTFLASIPNTVRNCFNLPSTNNHVNNWREIWHPQKVQVWGRIAEDKNDSQAIEWFHRDNFIKRTELTGSIGKSSKVSRIWHRMYPLYVKLDGKIMHKKNEDGNYKYIELLTIFTPDDLPKAREFINYLNNSSNDFIKLWGGN